MLINEELPGQLSRKEREKLLRRNEIIAAARSVFALRGFNDATLDEIAEKAEFGKGTLYNYFQNKDELFEAVISTSYERVIEIARGVSADETRDVRTAYTEIARVLLHELLQDSGVILLLMRDFNKPITTSKLVTYFPQLVSCLERPLKRGIERGEIRECSTEEVAAMYVSSIFSLYKFKLLKQHLCDNEVLLSKIPKHSEEEIQAETEHVLQVLQGTFFEGLLKRYNKDEGASS